MKPQQDARALALLSAVLGLFSATRQKKERKKKEREKHTFCSSANMEKLEGVFAVFDGKNNHSILVT